MEVTPDPNNPDVKYISFKDEVKVTNENVIFADFDVNVIIDYFWDAHGKLEHWKGPNGKTRDGVHAGKVEIIERETVIQWNSSEEPHSYVSWILKIDGVENNSIMTVYSFNKRKKLFIKAIVGAG